MKQFVHKGSLSYQVLVAVLLGIFAGIFFGPLCKLVKPIGDAFTMLLQMVVLPYLCFSLIHGLGSISPSMGKRLLKSGWPFFLAIWLFTLLLIYLLGQLIPSPKVAFLASPSAPNNSPLSRNFLSYLVPENPFYDLANNIVPAVAIFGLIVGCALMQIEKKEPLCGFLERVIQTIEKILEWLAAVAPIGAFAHIAYATGTVHLEDLYKLEFYVICFIAISLLITFWLLPLFLRVLTPLTYREILKGFKAVCLIPFVTGLPTIALPFITRYLRKLAKDHEAEEPNIHETYQTVLPVAYSFGQIGNCMTFFFFLFLSFYYRHPFVGSEKGLLSLLTIPMSIGSSATSINAVSFLIEQLDFPPDSVQLLTETMAITLNFQVLMSVAAVLTLIILTLYAYYGLLQVRWHRLLTESVVGVTLFALLVLSAKSFIHLGDKYQNLYPQLTLSAVIQNPVQATIFKAGESGTLRDIIPNEDPLQRVLRTGILKVGYHPDNIPYCYLNEKGELVGYDMAYAYQLARDLDCKLELIWFEINELSDVLASGTCDIVMAAILMIEQRLPWMDFTHPYSEQENVLIVPLAKKELLLDLQKATLNPNLVIGATGGYSYVLERHFPLATPIYSQMLDLVGEFETHHADAWVWSRIPAFVWCLSHPDYAIIDYGGLIGKRYFAYPVRSDSPDFISFLNSWLSLKEQSKFQSDMYNYWVRGQLPKPSAPRGSVLGSLLKKK